MAAPVVSFYEDDDLTEFDEENIIDFGVVDAATTSDEIEVHVWNNKAGESIVSDMTNVRATIATHNGLLSGDPGPSGTPNLYGQEVVEDTWIQIKEVGGETFTPIGGAVDFDLDDISGAIAGASDEVLLRAVVPSDASDGVADWNLWILYQYT